MAHSWSDKEKEGRGEATGRWHIMLVTGNVCKIQVLINTHGSWSHREGDRGLLENF